MHIEVYVLLQGFMYGAKEPAEEAGKVQLKFKPGRCSTTLIRTGKMNIIVDPGDLDDFNQLRRMLAKVKPKEKGLSPSDIDLVINTHDHPDHNESNVEFTDAGVDILDYHNMDEKEKLLPKGISLLKTPGHSKDSISVLVDDAIVYKMSRWLKRWKLETFDKAIVVGDAVIDKFFFANEIVFPNTWSKTQMHLSIGKIAKAADCVIPGHGPYFDITKLKLKPQTRRDFDKLLSEVSTFPRNRNLKDYLFELKSVGLPPPKVKPGMRVLDLGCGQCRATFDLINIVSNPVCTNPECFRHEHPYRWQDVLTLVDAKCSSCNWPMDVGRVTAVDISDEDLAKGEKYLDKELDRKLFFILRTSEDELKNKLKISREEFKLPEVRTRLRDVDRKTHKKMIILYQTSAEELVSLVSDYFDLILSVHMFEYVVDILPSILDIIDVLKVGGKAYIVGSRPLYILDKPLTPSQKKELEFLVLNHKYPITIACQKLGIEKLYSLPEFLEKYVKNVKITVKKEKKSFIIEKTGRTNVYELKKKHEKVYELMKPRRLVPYTFYTI